MASGSRRSHYWSCDRDCAFRYRHNDTNIVAAVASVVGGIPTSGGIAVAVVAVAAAGAGAGAGAGVAILDLRRPLVDLIIKDKRSGYTVICVGDVLGCCWPSWCTDDYGKARED